MKNSKFDSIGYRNGKKYQYLPTADPPYLTDYSNLLISMYCSESSWSKQSSKLPFSHPSVIPLYNKLMFYQVLFKLNHC